MNRATKTSTTGGSKRLNTSSQSPTGICKKGIKNMETQTIDELITQLTAAETGLSTLSELGRKIEREMEKTRERKEMEDIKREEVRKMTKPLADRSLKDSEMMTATIVRKLESVEENITTGKIGERLGKRKGTGEKETRTENNSELKQQIRETGKEITSEITKTIDTVLTECMQDLHNAITYGGAAPEKEIISSRINKGKEHVAKQKEITNLQEVAKQQNAAVTNRYAEVTKGRNHQIPKTLHSILVTSNDKMDTAEEIINKTKKILKPEETNIQIERIRKVKDQRIIISCKNEQETNIIKEKIEASEDLSAEKVKNKDPLVIIKDIKFKMTDKDIRSALKNQNPDIYIGEKQEEEEIKIKYRRKTRDTERCHVIAQCTRCLNFGHGKKFCPDSVDRCSHCGGLHLRAECPDKKAGVPPQYCSCAHAELQNTEHNAFSASCSIREKWDSLARSTTAYE
ncbi:unnamed protein product [Diatraea saccharalis]|uniref:Gag-like protein n=1 Tax=Diatraea saccharalis TaxID=40085 RepID=A0A9N9QY35_9NEOP|nr:unnamed protein product [Diatraea saccharalis]